jgi:hypothetical protein
MLSPRVRNSFAMLALVLVILACGAPSVPVTGATEAAPVDAPAGDAAPTEAPASDTASGDAPAAGSSIQHTDIPVGLPEKTSGVANDFDSSKVLSSGSLVGGDRFTYGRFERPFNANAMDVYFSQIDIINTEVFQDEMWIYARISLKDLGSSSSQTAQYAVELDTTRNGKANWLVIVSKPESTEWTVNGVQVYQDTNKDVGGEMPALTDKNPVNGDGFDQLFFDQGQGDDPDTAWVRVSPNDANIVEVAIKIAAIGSPKQYLINMWAGHNLNPAKFDLNDAYTHEQAGASDAGLEYYYPIKEVAEIDNSCRIAVGFQPTGLEPGLCQKFAPQQINDPATGCTASLTQVYACVTNSDPSYACQWNSSTCSCGCTYIGPK